ncbi:uncharacterized protein LOC117100163, partial [Anneissia japonica]|uniref:uncharacterized protein LOC117100163 n=1 Tax=Anneissia japonica TaxID=1529436 RepID=UPI0014259297
MDEGVTVNGYLEFYANEQISSSELENMFRESGDGDGFIQTTSSSLVYMTNSLVINEMDDDIYEGNENESVERMDPTPHDESEVNDGTQLPEINTNSEIEVIEYSTYVTIEDSVGQIEGDSVAESSLLPADRSEFQLATERLYTSPYQESEVFEGTEHFLPTDETGEVTYFTATDGGEFQSVEEETYTPVYEGSGTNEGTENFLLPGRSDFFTTQRVTSVIESISFPDSGREAKRRKKRQVVNT